MREFTAFLGFCLTVLLGIVLVVIVVDPPPQNVPWGRLDVREPPGFFTSFKLAGFNGNLAECTAALSEDGIEFRTLPDKQGGQDFCTLENRVVLDKSAYAYSATVRGTCGLVAGLAVWEREVVKRAAEEHLDSPVERIEQFGLYSCRRVNGSPNGRPSQHATANAIDIQGFRLENGRTITLLRDWGDDTPEGRFLADVRDGSCDIFRSVLGPDYNALHRDHFHLDLGRFSICR